MSIVNDDCIGRPYRYSGETSEDKEYWYVAVPAVDSIRQAFFGAISKLGFAESYDPVSDVAAEYGSEIGASLTQIIPPEEVTIPGLQARVDLFARNALHNQASIVYNTNTAQPFGYHMSLPSNPQNGQIYWRNVYLKPGTYALDLLWVRELNSAIVDVAIQSQTTFTGQSIGSVDMHGLFANNQLTTLTFTISDTSPQALSLTAATKQAGSTGYRMNVTAVHLRLNA